jgi:NTP pyrophosphatase (non-canonical NTP hydrolase)
MAYFYKLIEEVGELAEVMRKNKRQCDGNIKGTIEEELSDVLYYTACIANAFQINLEDSFKQKEELNKLKWGK